ncbi:MAG: nucleotidyltransferase domain-containing protein [Planctomycetes bacterium]|nr:nucleotidyltransferase domain-containing protein [Planctomycetota bacterium]MCB9891011.1 nucleotidyltransferase domain-containing protein [Planctomycetota bacterium]MCB9919136.1 nucleotidyltransferase domain-containing protein [Planctomycetota bacterium]
MKLPSELQTIVDAFPHRLLFATVSGAHLYGFPSPDSDYDLRGSHVLPVEHLVGLHDPNETEERLGLESGVDLDLVSHDVRKFCRLLLKRNGYVLEQLLSPLVIKTTEEHQELISHVPGILTRHHAHHYVGFAQNQWRMFEREPRIKTLLYVYRVLLTGIHLMRSGEVRASLPALLHDYPQPGVADLVDAKMHGTEKQSLTATDVEAHAGAFARLLQTLERARDESHLPDRPSAFEELDRFVIRARFVAPGA